MDDNLLAKIAKNGKPNIRGSSGLGRKLDITGEQAHWIKYKRWPYRKKKETACALGRREKTIARVTELSSARTRTRARLYFHAARLALGEARYNDNSAEGHFRHDISHHRDPSR